MTETETETAKNGKRKANHLAGERSPYLQQHAYNPVDWYPYGEEAFALARSLDKPLFISVGYSTCHWCHVMERECFEDAEVAKLMNSAFVNVKVDREQRPDVDDRLMEVCLTVNGSGGWPLNVVTTPDGKPFFAASYIPKGSTFGQVGMLQLVPRIEAMWSTQRQGLLHSADEIAAAIRSEEESTAASSLSTSPPSASAIRKVLGMALEAQALRFDTANGGFGSGTKFPTPHAITLLLRLDREFESKAALRMAERTLQAMRTGGLRDHLGGGFHRYATDAEWRVPHFEKMLYDQAGLAIAYTEAYIATGSEAYAATARETLEYVLRDLSAGNGAFFAAEDADSEGVEGKFYTWTPDSIASVVGKDRAEVFLDVYGCSQAGSREAVALHVKGDFADVAAKRSMSVSGLEQLIDGCKADLLRARNAGRVRPHRDENVLADWNCWAAVAFARASRALRDDSFARAAVACVDFVLAAMSNTADGGLLHHYKDGVASVPGILDDYAYAVWALCEVYQATFDSRHLSEATRIASVAEKKFLDEDTGGYLFVAKDSKGDVGGIAGAKKKPIADGAMPSGNSAMLMGLLLLASLTEDEEVQARANKLLISLWGKAAEAPVAHCQFLAGAMWVLGPSYHVTVAAPNKARAIEECRNVTSAVFVPSLAVGWDEGKRKHDSEAAFFVCSGKDCRAPVYTVSDVVLQITPSEQLTDPRGYTPSY